MIAGQRHKARIRKKLHISRSRNQRSQDQQKLLAPGCLVAVLDVSTQELVECPGVNNARADHVTAKVLSYHRGTRSVPLAGGVGEAH